MYQQEIERQEKEADPLGTIYSLLEAGEKLAPFLSPQQHYKNKIRRIWQETGQRLSDTNGWEAVSTKINDIDAAFVSNPYITVIFDSEINSPVPDTKQSPLSVSQLAALRRRRVAHMYRDDVPRETMARMEGVLAHTIIHDISKTIQPRVVNPAETKARRDALLKKIQEHGSVSPMSFSKEWKVTTRTVERDLDYLRTKKEIGGNVTRRPQYSPPPGIQKRRVRIREVVTRGELSVVEIAQMEHVAPVTIKRDIKKLKNDGLIDPDVVIPYQHKPDTTDK